MRNKKLIILIVLGIGAIFSLIYGINTSSKGRRKAPSGETIIHPGEKIRPAKKETVPALRHRVKTDFVMWARNPFVPKAVPVLPSPAPAPAPVVPSPVPSTLKLTLDGIMWDEENPKAIINGKQVGIGDKIGENKVVDIEKNRVILNNGVKDIVLRLSR